MAWFDWSSKQWKEHDHGLLSKNSSNLVVTSFPLSAVDCHAGCTCGRVNNLGGARIVGGNEAKVSLRKKMVRFMVRHQLFPGERLPLDSSFDQRRGQEGGSDQHQVQLHSGELLNLSFFAFNSCRSEAPGWSRQPTASTKMVNKLLRQLSLSFLDSTIGAKNQR